MRHAEFSRVEPAAYGVLVRQGARVGDVAAACAGGLVAVTLPAALPPIEIMWRAATFGAAMRRANIVAVSPLALAHQQRFATLRDPDAGWRPERAVATGFGEVLHRRSDALAVLCLPGWEDCSMVAADMAQAVISNRRVYLIDEAPE